VTKVVGVFVRFRDASLVGSLLLLPILILNLVVNIPEFVTLGWFGITVLLMLVEHSEN
jgi:hypothetical protein